MAREISAGLLAFQLNPLRVFLVKPGGPFFRNRERGVWGIPKGRLDGQQPLEAAKREFEEETGVPPDSIACSPYYPLESITYRSGKRVIAYALHTKPFEFKQSITFTIEYPPHSGVYHEFPEISEGRWFTINAAREYMLPSQQPFLDRLEQLMKTSTITPCPHEDAAQHEQDRTSQNDAEQEEQSH